MLDCLASMILFSSPRMAVEYHRRGLTSTPRLCTSNWGALREFSLDLPLYTTTIELENNKSKENSPNAPQLDVHNLGVEVNPAYDILQPCKDSKKESWAPSNPTSLQLWTVTKTEKSENSFWKMAPLSNETLLHSVTRSLLWFRTFHIVFMPICWRTRHRESWLAQDLVTIEHVCF